MGKRSTIKVAFLGFDYSKEIMGSMNYINNLLYAVSCLENKKINIIVFLGNNVDAEIKDKLAKHTRIVQNSLFDRGSTKWYIHKILEKLFKITYLLEKLLQQYEIEVISHSYLKYGCKKFTKIDWIPDFQHVHLPDFFPDKDNKERDKAYLDILQKSNAVIVSSYDAYKDAKAFDNRYSDKINVLQFVSQPNEKVLSLNLNYLKTLEEKYKFQGKFFYLPNQFWKHKNHLRVFKAIKLLKNEKIEVLLLCSGYMKDYRNPEYIEELKTYIHRNNLEENIHLLGLIDYDDVLCFMRYSVAVVNPSLFEGWSSTVEECKSIGKNMVLSNIAIHKEQNPNESLYFDPLNENDITKVLKKVWVDKTIHSPNFELESKAKQSLKKRTLKFANSYQEIILKNTKKIP